MISLVRVYITAMWGMYSSTMVYEGCDILLANKRPCALGKIARKSRQIKAEYREIALAQNQA